MEEKTLKINNLDKLSHSEHREITPVWQVIKTFCMYGSKSENPYKYEIYLERLGVTPPNVLQVNIHPTIKTIDVVGFGTQNVVGGGTQFVEVEIQRYTNTTLASTSSPKLWKTQVEIHYLKTLDNFKEYLKEGVIAKFGKTL